MNPFSCNAFGAPGSGSNPLTSQSIQFLKLWTAPKLWQVNWPADGNNAANGYYIETRTGTGVISTNGFAVLCESGATSNSRANARLLAKFEGMGLAASDSVDWRQLDWTQPLAIGFSLSVFAATTNGSIWVKIGNGSASAGDLASAGVQVRVDNLSLYFGAHNGSALDESAAQTLSAANRQHDVQIVGDGTGNYQFYLDGVLIDTLAGPTASINFDTRLAAEAFNDTDSANAAIWCSAFKLGVLP